MGTPRSVISVCRRGYWTRRTPSVGHHSIWLQKSRSRGVEPHFDQERSTKDSHLGGITLLLITGLWVWFFTRWSQVRTSSNVRTREEHTSRLFDGRLRTDTLDSVGRVNLKTHWSPTSSNGWWIPFHQNDLVWLEIPGHIRGLIRLIGSNYVIGRSNLHVHLVDTSHVICMYRVLQLIYSVHCTYKVDFWINIS